MQPAANLIIGRRIGVPHCVLLPIGALEQRSVVLSQSVDVVRGQERRDLQQLVGEDEPTDVHGIKAKSMTAICSQSFMIYQR